VLQRKPTKRQPRRDLTAAQFFQAAERHGIRFSMWQGWAFIGPRGRYQRVVCYHGAGTTRRAWLAYLLKEISALEALKEREHAA
jgi:hypothetical protein